MQKRLYVALDKMNYDTVKKLVDILPTGTYFKVGADLFTKYGVKMIALAQSKGGNIFLDLKFKDTRDTVYEAVYNATMHNVNIINVHSDGGPEMMELAVQARDKALKDSAEELVLQRPLLIAVTVLTSIEQPEFEIIMNRSQYLIADHVTHLSKLTYESGMDGVVCAVPDLKSTNDSLPVGFKKITPGIRFADEDANDQKRKATPDEAMKNGANYLVVGRPIIQSDDPVRSLLRFLNAMYQGYTARYE